MIAIELAARHPSIPRAVVADDPGPVFPTDVASRVYSGFAEELAGPSGEEVRRTWVVEGVGSTASDELRRKIVETMAHLLRSSARIEGVPVNVLRSEHVRGAFAGLLYHPRK